MMGFNADDFLLVRNPAIKIIGKRNEREGGTTSTSSHRPEVSAKTAAAAPRNQDSTGAAAATWKLVNQQQQQPAAAPSSPSTLPPPSPANEKPEPRLATTSSGTAAVTAAGAAAVPQPVPESSQLWSSKEEASSRLEALLKNTASHCNSADKNDRRQPRDLKNHSAGLCHLVKFEAKRPSQPSISPPSNSKSRLPRGTWSRDKELQIGSLVK